jgi:GntR family transcriptional regulator, transcriptional repressor for pyruvate dehydrogenase complex
VTVEVPRSRRRRANTENGDSTEAPFEPIQQVRAHEYVAEQIRRHIGLRLIRPGESLPSERELASMFGVGRPTIQHAMRVLEADHLVEARRGRGGGTFVREPAEDSAAMDELVARVLRQGEELEDLLGWRRALEPVVAREAARARRRTDVTAMWRAIRKMNQAPAEADYMRYDTELHIAIAAATRNRFMRHAIEEVRLRLNDALSLLPESDAWHRRLSREHETIVAAIEARDADGATAAMSLHVANSVQGVRAALAAIKRRLAS